MATEFPIPEDYGRFIPPMSAEEESGEIGEIPLSQLFSADAQEEIEEMEDGSAIVRMSDLKTPDESPDFYTNMAEDLDSWELSKIAIKYIDLIEKDKQAREDRDKQYEEGLRRTGLGHDAPGGASFMGASRVVHPCC